mgnify:CR=1 FL=1|tara:strand:- start:1516 stop:1707 length:192 start_codon:yes stop_codon:yes gene_type:complete
MGLGHLKLKIIKLTPKNKANFFGKNKPTKFNYIVYRGNKVRGFKTLGELNRMLGTRYKVGSFK